MAFSALAAQRPVSLGTVATIPGREAAFLQFSRAAMPIPPHITQGREAAFVEFGRAAMPIPPHITQGREAAFVEFGRAAMPVPYLPVRTVAAYRRAAARQSIIE